MDTTGFDYQGGGRLDEAVVAFAPDWMDLFTIEVWIEGGVIGPMRVIVPPLCPDPPTVPEGVRREAAAELQELERDGFPFGVMTDRRDLAWLHVEIRTDVKLSFCRWADDSDDTPDRHFLQYLKIRRDAERLKIVRANIARDRRRARRRKLRE